MKICKIIFLFLICSLSAQKNLAFDSLKLKEVRDLFADDYGNIYLYKNKDFSFTKYDSLGNQKGKLMLTLPFKIQSVQNPLNIPSFSENAQELKFFDQNLNEIQTVNFRQKFGFIRMVYAEDLQQLWLLDESMKRLIQYNFRDNKIVNSFPFDINFEDLTDFLVFESKVYFLGRNQFSVYNFKAEKIIEQSFKNGRRLRRENQNILIMSENSVQKFEDFTLKTIFSSQYSQIVDKNSAAYFVIKDNKLYLYKP
ncbi:hypothetical protein [Kaistella jeonii]|uniref:Uncharacterized protein n=1 Tax=Kaistella jeonii TaxID=266749 RepID=A0A0C1CPP7_9FLAO|nr:hypothetical protein [Kaistella jeonii]KIA86061.1 hypothetical protein OA86_13615 [Kaistella jeonii]SFC34485.1 hypothetical protein SAMN05421876_1156 [Kaistella jeonii]VEI95313.1 Uncharacterised protein [Kaistella jeonii]